LDGTIASTAVYGFVVALTLDCLSNLVKGRSGRDVKWGFVVYVVIIFGFATLYIGASAKWVELMFIDNRNYPGGPVGYYTNVLPTIYIFVVLSYAIINFMAGGLLLYRCFVVWNRRWYIIVIPCAMYVSTIVLVALAANSLLGEDSTYFTGARLAFTLPLYSISIALNLLLSGLIAGRIWSARSRFRAVLGSQQAHVYTSVTSMIVESAAIYSISSLVAIANFGSDPSSYSFNFVNVSWPINAMAMTISQILIISKVAKGQAYTEGAVTGITASSSSASIHFASGDTSMTAPVGSVGSVEMRSMRKRDRDEERRHILTLNLGTMEPLEGP